MQYKSGLLKATSPSEFMGLKANPLQEALRIFGMCSQGLSEKTGKQKQPFQRRSGLTEHSSISVIWEMLCCVCIQPERRTMHSSSGHR